MNSVAASVSPSVIAPASPYLDKPHQAWPEPTDQVLLQTRDLTVFQARSTKAIRQSLALRYRVFVTEMGANADRCDAEPGLECDEFDAVSDHIVAADSQTGQVLATCRVLRRAANGSTKSRCSMMAREFDMDRLDWLGDGLMELGRTCVSPGHRDGRTIRSLWAGLLRYLDGHRFTHLAGAVSLPYRDGGMYASAVFQYLLTHHCAAPGLQIRPRHPAPLVEHDNTRVRPAIPPLLRSYLRMGAEVIGEPFLDKDFNCVDLPMIVARKRLDTRIIDRLR